MTSFFIPTALSFRTRRLASLAAIALTALVAAGCNAPAQLGVQVPPTGPTILIGPKTTPSTLVVSVAASVPSRDVAAVLTNTSQPGENIAIAQVNSTSEVLGSAPLPVEVPISPRPSPVGKGATTFQNYTSTAKLARWQTAKKAAEAASLAITTSKVSTWSKSLAAKLPTQFGTSADLGSALQVASDATATLAQAATLGHRVILAYVSSLAGSVAPGSLSGTTVLVVVAPSRAPSASESATVQTALISAGAIRVEVLPQSVGIASMIDQAVSAGLATQSVSDNLSGATLFANNSATLGSSAATVLAPVAKQLIQTTNASAIIIGFASATGSPSSNLTLSAQRAASVANWLEHMGVPAAKIIAVGEGANDFVAPGPSGLNRRVIVEIVAG